MFKVQYLQRLVFRCLHTSSRIADAQNFNLYVLNYISM